MNIKLLIITFSLSTIVSGCATGVSTSRAYGSTNVGVSFNGHSSGAAIVGALIAGGIIGTILANEKDKKKQKVHSSSQISELISQDSVQNANVSNTVQASYQVKDQVASNIDSFPQPDYQDALSTSTKATEWYQLGKDGNCYLMSVSNGVSDIISAVPNNQCGKND